MTDDSKNPPARRAPRKRGGARKKQAPAADAPKQDPQAGKSSSPDAGSTGGMAAAAGERELARIAIHVRWRDLDAFNHVNNSSYLTYLEESRLQWLRSVPGEWFNEHSMPVMAAVELHYRQPITWPSEIDVLLSCRRLGTTSMTIGNRIVDRNDPGRVYADGHIVMVWVDPGTGAPVQLPDAIRQAVA